MHNVPFSDVKRWEALPSNHKVPTVISLQCPNCAVPASFSVAGWSAVHNAVANGSAACPACDSRITVIAVSVSGDPLTCVVWVIPSPRGRSPIEGLDQLKSISPQLIETYASLLRNFNQHDWVASTMLSRRMLEGMVGVILKDDGKGLVLDKQIEKLPEYVDSTKPVTVLAHLVRQVGNFGVHFNSGAVPDQQTAEATLNLLEYLVEFIFILPKKIFELEEMVERLKSERKDRSNVTPPTTSPRTNDS